MKIQVLCDSVSHPILNSLNEWVEFRIRNHDIKLVASAKAVTEGDILFLISCNEILKKEVMSAFRCVLVVHASDLPMGRGWSPHIWQVLEGKNEIVISLLEAEELVDTGRIWKKIPIQIKDTDLYDDINKKLFKAELDLMDWAIDNIDSVQPEQQSGESFYYQKRFPEDSELDIQASLESQMNLLRVCDPDRYPAFFNYCGETYTLKIEKVKRDV